MEEEWRMWEDGRTDRGLVEEEWRTGVSPAELTVTRELGVKMFLHSDTQGS